MRPLLHVLLALTLISAAPAAPELESKPADPFFAKFEPLAARNSRTVPPERGSSGDHRRFDHGAEQYSRLIETYLTVCAPELEITARQYGWSGERCQVSWAA